MNATGLDLTTWLQAVAQHGHRTREHLIAQGHHPNVIYAKAEKSARRGYTDYGVIADRPWLTDKGRAWLAAQGVTVAEPESFTTAELMVALIEVLDTTSGPVVQTWT